MCLITLVRLILVFRIDYNDETYTWIIFGMFTTLEFYLGIITACLPLLPPVGAEIVKTFHDSKLSSLLSRSRTSTWRIWTGSRSKSDTLGQKSTDDSLSGNPQHHHHRNSTYYPLEDRPSQGSLTTTHSTHVSYPLAVSKYNKDGIMVISDYSVQSLQSGRRNNEL